MSQPIDASTILAKTTGSAVSKPALTALLSKKASAPVPVPKEPAKSASPKPKQSIVRLPSEFTAEDRDVMNQVCTDHGPLPSWFKKFEIVICGDNFEQEHPPAAAGVKRVSDTQNVFIFVRRMEPGYEFVPLNLVPAATASPPLFAATAHDVVKIVMTALGDRLWMKSRGMLFRDLSGTIPDSRKRLAEIFTPEEQAVGRAVTENSLEVHRELSERIRQALNATHIQRAFDEVYVHNDVALSEQSHVIRDHKLTGKANLFIRLLAMRNPNIGIPLWVARYEHIHKDGDKGEEEGEEEESLSLEDTGDNDDANESDQVKEPPRPATPGKRKVDEPEEKEEEEEDENADFAPAAPKQPKTVTIADPYLPEGWETMTTKQLKNYRDKMRNRERRRKEREEREAAKAGKTTPTTDVAMTEADEKAKEAKRLAEDEALAREIAAAERAAAEKEAERLAEKEKKTKKRSDDREKAKEERKTKRAEKSNKRKEATTQEKEDEQQRQVDQSQPARKKVAVPPSVAAPPPEPKEVQQERLASVVVVPEKPVARPASLWHQPLPKGLFGQPRYSVQLVLNAQGKPAAPVRFVIIDRHCRIPTGKTCFNEDLFVAKDQVIAALTHHQLSVECSNFIACFNGKRQFGEDCWAFVIDCDMQGAIKDEDGGAASIKDGTKAVTRVFGMDLGQYIDDVVALCEIRGIEGQQVRALYEARKAQSL